MFFFATNNGFTKIEGTNMIRHWHWTPVFNIKCIVFILYYRVTFLIILPICCYNLKYSMYYIRPSTSQIGQEQLRRENSARIQVLLSLK